MPSEFDSTGNVISRATQSYSRPSTAISIRRNNHYDVLRRKYMSERGYQNRETDIHKTGSPNLVPGRK